MKTRTLYFTRSLWYLNFIHLRTIFIVSKVLFNTS
jgi:hypothetical protein